MNPFDVVLAEDENERKRSNTLAGLTQGTCAISPPSAQSWRPCPRLPSSSKTVVIKGGSHVVMTSQPEAVAALIREAAGN